MCIYVRSYVYWISTGITQVNNKSILVITIDLTLEYKVKMRIENDVK